NAGPRGPKYSMKEKLRSFAQIGEVVALFALVMGGIIAGWFTPTEAGAIGSAGALLIAIVRRRLTHESAKTAIYSTLKTTRLLIAVVRRRLTSATAQTAGYWTLSTTGMICGIRFGAMVFTSRLTASTLPLRIGSFVTEGGFPRMVVLLMILVVYFLLGMGLDP